MNAQITNLLAQAMRNSPLRHGTFRVFYVGSVGTALGYTMQATVAAWLMATLTPSALMVALVQTSSTAPSLLFGLAGGALADIVDRRRIIFATQIAMIVGTLAVGVATLFGVIAPVPLLLLTFAIGTGFTFYMPAQQSSINDLVARTDLARAVALGAVAFNVARAIGPALAGALAAWIGTGNASLASAIFFVVMIFALRQWKGTARTIPGVPETLLSGIRSGLRYARHAPALRALIIRNLSFAVCASALWALLPVIARDQLGLGPGGYGLLSAAFGVGAVTGALAIPRQLQRVSLNRVVTSGALLWIVATVLVAVSNMIAFALLGALASGAAWVSVFASLSAGTQSAAPAWVRARAVATNLVATQASLAAGSALWGWVATLYGTPLSLGASAATMAVLFTLNRRVHVKLGEEADVTPGTRLPDLAIAMEPEPDDGPVLIQIEYHILPDKRDEFLRTIQLFEPIRRRNGASSWRVFRDLGEEDRFVERYIIVSWAEYVRLRTRMTIADRRILDSIEHMQKDDVPSRVSRLIGVDAADMSAAISAVTARHVGHH